MRSKFTVIIFVFVFFAFYFLFFASGCAKQKPSSGDSKSESKPLTENISQEASNFTLSSVGDDGASNWQLVGESAVIGEDKIDLKNIQVNSQANNTRLTMKANKGIIKKNDGIGIFKEDVVLAYEDGTTIATDAVDWYFKKQVAKTSSPVFMKTGEFQTQALGASLKKGANQIQLDKDILMQSQTGTTIKCDGPLVMDYKKNVAVFNKNVSIENPKGKMKSRKMVVFFDPSKKAIKKIEAAGNVSLIRGSSISTSDKATYFSEEGRAILTGHPKVFIDSQEARKINKEVDLIKTK